jgi:4-hydroxybenzoate polyprenyltransferase
MTQRTLFNVAVLALLTALVAVGGAVTTTGALTGWDWLLAVSAIALIVSAGLGLVRESM